MAQQALIDPNFQKLVSHIQQLKNESYSKRTNNEAVPWVRPPVAGIIGSLLGGWSGDLQTEGGLKRLHAAFQTDKAEEALTKAFEPNQGNSSDGIALSLQIDYAAQAERAYRARVYQPFHRALAHFAAREKGHGQQTGALHGSTIDYINLIIKQGG